MTPEIYGTYQNFDTTPVSFSVDLPNGQQKLRPQVFDEFPAASHPQRIHQNKILLWEQANAGQQHQPYQRPDLLKMDAQSHVPQRYPSRFPSSVAPVHLRSTHYRENLARAPKVFRDAGADHGQSDDSLGNAATLHDAHVLAQRHFSGTPDSKNGLA